MVTFGGDISALGKAMRGAVSGAKEMAGKMKGIFTSAFGALGVGLGISSIIGGIRSLGQEIKQLKSDAEVGGVSVKFIQTLRNAGIASGVTAEQVSRLLNKLEQSIPIGSDVEEEFLKMSDAIAATNDPIEKMNIAVAMFGTKLGPVMVDIAGQGSKALTELGNSLAKYSDRQIGVLERGNRAWEKTVNLIKVGSAQVLVFADAWVRAAKLRGDYLKAGMGDISMKEAGRLLRLTDQAAAKKKADADAELKEANRMAGLQEAANKQDADAAKNLTILKGKMAATQIGAAKESLTLAEKELAVIRKQKEARDDFGKLSLGDLADRGNRSAQRAQGLKSQIENAEAMGNSGLAASLREQYRQTVSGISGLTSGERMPFAQDSYDKALQDAQGFSDKRTLVGNTWDTDRNRRTRQLQGMGRDNFNRASEQRNELLLRHSEDMVKIFSTAIKNGAMLVDIKDPDS
jgi:hypothetical protein